MNDEEPRIVFFHKIEQVIRLFLGPIRIYGKNGELQDPKNGGRTDADPLANACIRLESRCTELCGRCISQTDNLRGRFSLAYIITCTYKETDQKLDQSQLSPND
jgi:hypothetical protein